MSKPIQVPLNEGHQPMIKGHQAVEFGQQPVGDTIFRGYSPEVVNLSTSTPPQGGSGVPPVKVEAKPSEANTQASDKKQ
ncbi:MAG: hypothetical protein ABSA44_12720 [Bacteroidota bacterium]